MHNMSAHGMLAFKGDGCMTILGIGKLFGAHLTSKSIWPSPCNALSRK